jgi:hypothetical protein
MPPDQESGTSLQAMTSVGVYVVKTCVTAGGKGETCETMAASLSIFNIEEGVSREVGGQCSCGQPWQPRYNHRCSLWKPAFEIFTLMI